MKKLGIVISLFITIFLITSCGYRNPYVYHGDKQTVYINSWKNRTSELGLDAQIYQSLVKWFEKSGSISVTRNRKDADLILGGEIISINLPSLSYGSGNDATEVKLKLRTRYVLKDKQTGKLIVEKPNELWTQVYSIGADTIETRKNRKTATAIIVEDLSQQIYQKCLIELPKLSQL